MYQLCSKSASNGFLVSNLSFTHWVHRPYGSNLHSAALACIQTFKPADLPRLSKTHIFIIKFVFKLCIFDKISQFLKESTWIVNKMFSNCK